MMAWHTYRCDELAVRARDEDDALLMAYKESWEDRLHRWAVYAVVVFIGWPLTGLCLLALWRMAGL